MKERKGGEAIKQSPCLGTFAPGCKDASKGILLLHCQGEPLVTPHSSKGKGYVQGCVPEKMTMLVFSLKPWHSVLFLVHLVSVVI